MEVHSNDVLLRADTVEDHLERLEEVLRFCEECHTEVKLSNCEFMKESLEYLGFEVSWRWWRPVKDKVAPILQATFRDNKTQGAKNIRGFLGVCIFPGDTYLISHTPATCSQCDKKDKKWHRGEEEAKHLQEVKEKVRNIGMLGTPNSIDEFVVITGASLLGGVCTLFQWQKLPQLVACTVAEELQKTLACSPVCVPGLLCVRCLWPLCACWPVSAAGVLCVRCPWALGACAPVYALGVWCVRRPWPLGACSPMCALSLFCVRRPWPPGACSPVCPLGLL